MSWETLTKGTQTDKDKPQVSDDGSDKLFATVFSGPNGKKVIEYLEMMTFNVFANPQSSSNNLWHLEGQRYLLGIIKNKSNRGKKNG